MTRLQLGHFEIVTSQLHQVSMTPLLCYLPIVNDDDAIRMPDRAETMSNHEIGPGLHEFHKTFLDEAFTFTVKVAGRFVQNQDFWVSEYGTRDG